MEDLPGLILSTWRLVYIISSFEVGLTFRHDVRGGLTWDNLDAEQVLPAFQLLLSAIVVGFQLCNTKDFIRLSAAHLKSETKLAKVVATASTKLDAFEGVMPSEITGVLRLRKILGGALKQQAREVAGDVMLLRFIRGAEGAPRTHDHQGGGDGGEGAGGQSTIDKAVAMAAVVASSLSRRERVGANYVRTRILRDDLVRAR